MYWFSASSLQVRLVRGPAHTCETAAAINARLLPEMMQKRGRISKLPGMSLEFAIRIRQHAISVRKSVGHSWPASTGASAPLYASRLLSPLTTHTLRFERWPEDSRNTHERLPAKQSSFSRLASQRLPCVPTTALFLRPKARCLGAIYVCEPGYSLYRLYMHFSFKSNSFT